MKAIRFLTIFGVICFFLISSLTSIKAIETLTPNQFENEAEAVAEKITIANQNIDSMVSYLNTVKAKIESSSFLTSDQKNNITSEINDQIIYLEGKKEAIGKSTTIEGIHTLTLEVSTYWDSVYVKAISWNGVILQAKADDVYTQLQEISQNLETEINTAGKQDSATQTYLELAKLKLEDLDTKNKLAADKFAQIQDKDYALIYFVQGKQYLQEGVPIINEVISGLDSAIYFLEK